MKINSTALGFTVLAVLFGSILASMFLGVWQTGGEGQHNRGGHSEADAASQQVFTLRGIVTGYDTSGLAFLTNEGQSITIQIGNSRYHQSIGFAPQSGESATINGYINSAGIYNAVSITLDATDMTYYFRDENGNPLWSRGNGNGNGNGESP